MTRNQAIAALKTKIDGMRAVRSLTVVEAPKMIATRELFLQVGKKRYQVSSIREAVDMHNIARDNADHGVSKMPPVTIVSSTGLHLYRISYNGRVWSGELGEGEVTNF